MREKEFYIISRDNKTKLHCKKYMPEPGTPFRGIVQIVHGMSEHVERYRELSKYLTEMGYVVVGEDHLGHGRTVQEGKIFGYFCEQDPATILVRDVHRLKKIVQAEYPNLPYFILGHSMGSFILRNYMLHYGSGIAGAIVMGTGMQPLKLLKLARKLVQFQTYVCGSTHQAHIIDRISFSGYCKKIPDSKSPYDWLTRDPAGLKKHADDPFCGHTFTLNGFRALFDLIYRLYDEEAMQRMAKDLPVYVVSGDADPVGDYGEAVRKTYDSLLAAGMQDVTLKLYEGARHELINELNKDEVFADIHAWLEEKRLLAVKKREIYK
jgi:alpha-beta hydrolase superfamily lysophospholipase